MAWCLSAGVQGHTLNTHNMLLLLRFSHTCPVSSTSELRCSALQAICLFWEVSLQGSVFCSIEHEYFFTEHLKNRLNACLTASVNHVKLCSFRGRAGVVEELWSAFFYFLSFNISVSFISKACFNLLNTDQMIINSASWLDCYPLFTTFL